MKKHLLTISVASVLCMPVLAESLCVNLKNGKTISYNIDDIEDVTICDDVIKYTELNYEIIDGTSIKTGSNSAYACKITDDPVIIPSKEEIDGNLYDVTTIGFSSFMSQKFEAVIIPNSITTIESNAFIRCTKLKEIEFSKYVTSIGIGALQECYGLKKITVDPENPNYKSDNGNLYNKNMTELLRVPGGYEGDFVVPSSVTYIESDAFGFCPQITNIEIPNSVTAIGTGAFARCSALTSIVIPDNVTTIGHGSFADSENLKSVTLSSSLEKIEGNLFANCVSLESLDIPASVAEINITAFLGCTGLTSINVDEDNPYYASVDGDLYNKDKSELIYSPLGKK